MAAPPPWINSDGWEMAMQNGRLIPRQVGPRQVCYNCLLRYADHPDLICSYNPNSDEPCNNCAELGIHSCTKINLATIGPALMHIMRLQHIAGNIALSQTKKESITHEALTHLQDMQNAVSLIASTLWSPVTTGSGNPNEGVNAGPSRFERPMRHVQLAAGFEQLSRNARNAELLAATNSTNALLKTFMDKRAEEASMQEFLDKKTKEVGQLRHDLAEFVDKKTEEVGQLRHDLADANRRVEVHRHHEIAKQKRIELLDQEVESLNEQINLANISGGLKFEKLPEHVKHQIFRYFLLDLPSIAARLSGTKGSPQIKVKLDQGSLVLRHTGPKVTEAERVVVGNSSALVGDKVILDHIQPYIEAADKMAIRELCLVSKDFRARCLFIQTEFKYLSYMVTVKAPNPRIAQRISQILEGTRRYGGKAQARKKSRGETVHCNAVTRSATKSAKNSSVKKSVNKSAKK